MDNETINLKPGGRVGLYLHRDFKNSLTSPIKPQNLILDFADADSIDSSGMGALLAIREEFKDLNIEIINANHNIVRTFEITKLDTMFNISEQ